MPTVWTNGNFTIIVRVRDEHPPPHVHVMDADNECLVEIAGLFHSKYTFKCV
ncbi:MAG: hypothetical protein DCF25_14585 [Leptolyngbya foveolarum]|uniref:DUF4160 domain-containing protein n=1 Tax=Leptolyngbya foveolarum TaxID=47253 RepID=A0A2W4U1M7_9CYAN|nr:MAG: hypothetical protein DCF25_14585 [Leptolyngbya foveolarum]